VEGCCDLGVVTHVTAIVTAEAKELPDLVYVLRAVPQHYFGDLIGVHGYTFPGNAVAQKLDLALKQLFLCWFLLEVRSPQPDEETSFNRFFNSS